ncbi:STAS domain-containing protein [Jiella mangrovi]|uniref:Anti-sigma factor antagonist n=1 Tax=Jiella mangrovi TaxID=2821407 RepID=A0ABS4BIA9_9HYPH|nr:STAS domain-containing protein [Jiella mangrovi]MBP0616494.1 STAS domain-containing protein [Jiella mangrovi]
MLTKIPGSGEDPAIFSLDAPRLTAANSPAFRQEMADLISAGATRVVLDLSPVAFIDSTGLGSLVAILKQIGSRGDLAICGVQPGVQQMFKLTRMDRVFRIYPNLAAASAALESA